MDSGSETQTQVEPSAKKPRMFIARQACEYCRAKKTRCDEDFPCSQCQAIGIECKYSNRKATRKEESFSAIFSCLSRVEKKVDKLGIAVNQNTGLHQCANSNTNHILDTDNTPPANPAASIFEHLSDAPLTTSSTAYDPTPSSAVRSFLPFSPRRAASWTSLWHRLPPEVLCLLQEGNSDYVTAFEIGRKPPIPVLELGLATSGLLDAMNVAVVRDLSLAYFATFNLSYPVLDRDLFNGHTLPTAITNGFGYDVETCVVLVTMALGCWGKMALEEATLNQQAASASLGLSLDQFSSHDTPGLVLFTECKRRMAFLLGDKGIQSCQCHLLLSLYDAQLARPLDAFDNLHHAANCCIMSWTSSHEGPDTWVADMQGRLYWITLMLESVLTDELLLPTSRLSELQGSIPLPKFVKMEGSVFRSSKEPQEIEILCQYHFLAQIAHRVLINNIKETLYHNEGGYNPSPLEDELSYQLQQWREQLPATIKSSAGSGLQPAQTPYDMIVSPWLRSRYLVAKWHIGRPFLYQVLAEPNNRSEEELERCRKILADMVKWEPILLRFQTMNSCLPLKFNLCSQLLGQVMIVYLFKQEIEALGSDVVPVGYESWLSAVMGCLNTCASSSPTLYQDTQIATILYQCLEKQVNPSA